MAGGEGSQPRPRTYVHEESELRKLSRYEVLFWVAGMSVAIAIHVNGGIPFLRLFSTNKPPGPGLNPWPGFLIPPP